MADDFRATARTTGTVEVGGSATGGVRAGGDRDRFAVELDVARHVASTPISATRDRSPSMMRGQGQPLDDSHDRDAGTRDDFRLILKPLVTSGMDGPW